MEEFIMFGTILYPRDLYTTNGLKSVVVAHATDEDIIFYHKQFDVAATRIWSMKQQQWIEEHTWPPS